MTTTGSAAAVGPPGCGDKAEGLKTHISTALSGLLDRTPDNRCGSGGSDRPPRRRLPPAHTSELAKEVRRLITGPIPARMVLLRAAERAAGVSAEVEPYACFYCECRFERESTLNRHMGRAHNKDMICPNLRLEEFEDDPDDPDSGEDPDTSWQEPKVSIWTPESPGGDVEDDGDFLCSESKPSVMGSSASECPVGSATRPMTTGTAVPGAGDGLSESGTAGEDSAAGAPVNSPRVPSRPCRDKLPAGKDVPVTFVVKEWPASKPPTDPAMSVARPGRSDDAGGLKTHISTAFGGLLERAISSRLEKGLDPSGSPHCAGRDRPTRSQRRQQRAEPCPPPTSESASSSRRWGRRVFDTELAERVRRQLTTGPRRTPVPPRRAAAPVAPSPVGPSDSYRYTCLYCDRRCG